MDYEVLEPRILFAADAPQTDGSSSDTAHSDPAPTAEPATTEGAATAGLAPAPVADGPSVAPAEPQDAPLLSVRSEGADPSSVEVVRSAAADAQDLLVRFFAAPDAAGDLARLFGSGDTTDAAASAFIDSVLGGNVSFEVRMVGDDVLVGARAAFVTLPGDGKPQILLNADWIAAGASEQAVARVLVEEFGHAVDHALNGAADTAGDEGEAFAVVVTDGGITPERQAVTDADQDHRQITLDGVSLMAETSVQRQVSLVFDRGYFGTQGTNTNKANDILKFASLDVARVAFIQDDLDGDGQFDGSGTQGNDISGTLKIYFTSGATPLSIPGALNWRETTGSTVEVFGFIFDSGQTGSFTYTDAANVTKTYTITGGATRDVSTTLGLQSIKSTWTFTDLEDRDGNAATSGLLEALNAYLADIPKPSSISVSTNNVVEGNNLVYSVSLSATTTTTSYFVFSTGGTATNGSDYINNANYTFSNGVTLNSDGTLTVPSGVSSFTITVPTYDDASMEGSETLDISVGSVTASGTILDNDGASISVSNVTVSESSPYAVFVVSLDRAAASSISFTPTLSNGTATVGTDTGTSAQLEYYDGSAWVSAASGITMAPGVTSVLVRTAITNDTTYEISETFTLSTGAVTGGVNNSNGASGTGTIKDDGTSTNVFEAGNNSSTPTTGSANDDSPAISITDVSVNENSPYAVFKVSLTGTSPSAITFTPNLTGTGATLNDDFGSTLEYYNGTAWVSAASGVTIPAGSTSVLFRTTITDDDPYEGAETFTLTTGAVTGGVSNSNGVTGTGTIRDDGTGAIYPDNTTGNPDPDAAKDDDRTVRVTDVLVNENSPYAVFTVSGAAGQSLALALSSGTATKENGVSPVATDGTEDFGPGLEYSLDGGATWQTYSTAVTLTGSTLLVRTPVIDDTSYEGSETFRLGVTTGGATSYGTATIVDDGTGAIYPNNTTGNPDPDAALDDDRAVRVDDIVVNEASPYAVFRVTSNASTSLTLSLRNDSDVTSADAALGSDTAAASTLEYFNGTSWQTYSAAVPVAANGTLLVRIAVSPDSVYEGAEKFQLVATPTSGTAGVGTATIMDDGTGAIYPNDPTGNPDPDAVRDDDRPVRVADILVNENSPYAVFTIKGTAGQNVTLGLQNDADGTTANAALGTDAATQLQYLLNGTWTNYTSGTVVLPPLS